MELSSTLVENRGTLDGNCVREDTRNVFVQSTESTTAYRYGTSLLIARH